MSITFSPKLHDPHPILKSETKDCLLKFDSDLKLETARKLSSQDIGQGVRKLIGHLVPLFGENVSSSHTDVVDILLENLKIATRGRGCSNNWKLCLWTYAGYLNRALVSRKDHNFTRIQTAFDLVLHCSYDNKPENIAELEMIRNHVSLSLKGRRNLTLDAIGGQLKSEFLRIPSNKNSTELDWFYIKKFLASKSFEMLYPSGEGSQDHLFLVDGQPALPPVTRQPDPNQMVVLGKEAIPTFIKFVEEFFSNIGKPEMTPRLMRRMILIMIDLADVALTQTSCHSQTLFKQIEIEGRNRVQKSLVLLWVWCGVRCNTLIFKNDSHTGIADKNIAQIQEIRKELRTHLMFNGITSGKKDEALWALEMWRRAKIKCSYGLSYTNFITTFNKFYPPLDKNIPCNNDLENKFLNIRVELGQETPFVINLNDAKKRLGTTKRGHFARDSSSSTEVSSSDDEVSSSLKICQVPTMPMHSGNNVPPGKNDLSLANSSTVDASSKTLFTSENGENTCFSSCGMNSSPYSSSSAAGDNLNKVTHRHVALQSENPSHSQNKGPANNDTSKYPPIATNGTKVGEKITEADPVKLRTSSYSVKILSESKLQGTRELVRSDKIETGKCSDGMSLLTKNVAKEVPVTTRNTKGSHNIKSSPGKSSSGSTTSSSSSTTSSSSSSEDSSSSEACSDDDDEVRHFSSNPEKPSQSILSRSIYSEHKKSPAHGHTTKKDFVPSNMVTSKIISTKRIEPDSVKETPVVTPDKKQTATKSVKEAVSIQNHYGFIFQENKDPFGKLGNPLNKWPVRANLGDSFNTLRSPSIMNLPAKRDSNNAFVTTKTSRAVSKTTSSEDSSEDDDDVTSSSSETDSLSSDEDVSCQTFFSPFFEIPRKKTCQNNLLIPMDIVINGYHPSATKSRPSHANDDIAKVCKGNLEVSKELQSNTLPNKEGSKLIASSSSSQNEAGREPKLGLVPRTALQTENSNQHEHTTNQSITTQSLKSSQKSIEPNIANISDEFPRKRNSKRRSSLEQLHEAQKEMGLDISLPLSKRRCTLRPIEYNLDTLTASFKTASDSDTTLNSRAKSNLEASRVLKSADAIPCSSQTESNITGNVESSANTETASIQAKLDKAKKKKRRRPVTRGKALMKDKSSKNASSSSLQADKVANGMIHGDAVKIKIEPFEVKKEPQDPDNEGAVSIMPFQEIENQLDRNSLADMEQLWITDMSISTQIQEIDLPDEMVMTPENDDESCEWKVESCFSLNYSIE